MRNPAKIALLSALLACSSLIFAGSRMQEAASFEDVKSILAGLAQPANTLVVFDDDDTLSMMPCKTPMQCTFLGTPSWFDWQASIKKNDPQRLFTSFDQLVLAGDTIIRNTTMAYTDPNEIAVLKWIQAHHDTLMVETARGPNMEAATKRQLNTLGILKIIQSDTLPVNHPIALGTKRPASYQDGIFFMSGLNKGEMLRELLAKAGLTHSYTHLVLIDDDKQNINALVAAYKDDPIVDAIGIYYTGQNRRKAAFMTGPSSETYKMKSLERWKAITSEPHQNT